MSNKSTIKRVIRSGPATIVFWEDGTKTVVKCSTEDDYDPDVGLLAACVKKACGNTNAGMKATLQQWWTGYSLPDPIADAFAKAISGLAKVFAKIGEGL